MLKRFIDWLLGSTIITKHTFQWQNDRVAIITRLHLKEGQVLAKEQFIGEETVWHHHPSGQRCPHHIEIVLLEIWDREYLKKIKEQSS